MLFTCTRGLMVKQRVVMHLTRIRISVTILINFTFLSLMQITLQIWSLEKRDAVGPENRFKRSKPAVHSKEESHCRPAKGPDLWK
jgi:hypothetical protein